MWLAPAFHQGPRPVFQTRTSPKANSGEQLHVEGFFGRRLKIQQADFASAAKVDDTNNALELIAALGQRHTVHCGRGADLLESDEGVRIGDRQPAGEARKPRDGFAPAGSKIGHNEATRPRFEHPQGAVVPVRRMGHLTSTGHELSRGDVDDAAAMRFIGAPTIADVGRAERRSIGGAALDEGQGRDERRALPRHKTVVGIEHIRLSHERASH